jgi:monooxygenase
MEHFDVIIVGAGLSGVGVAYHLKTRCPGKSFVLLEGRDRMGGTWDLFRYPGIRSDSDMYTLGYSFRPWREPQSIADGPSILRYIRETAEEYGIDRKVRYQHRLTRASWSSDDSRWTLQVERGERGETVRFSCRFLYMCTGYYDYESGYTPEWPGTERFAGDLIHPQKWPEDLDYTGRRVVVIGSGATAVTLVPAMSERAEHVTMLQRSPTYIVARPSEDRLANWLRRRLPARLAYGITRWKNVLLSMVFFNLARRRPEYTRNLIARGVRAELGPDYDVETHFSPTYDPWDQRLCLVPEADLFRSIRSGRVAVVTDQIETFTPDGIQLRSGEHLPADIIVTATGLNMKLMSGVELQVDGEPVELSGTMSYRGAMFSDVPNLALAFGYTNASWTLKSDLTAEYVCRLINYMDRKGYVQCTPRRDPAVEEEPVLDFTSGYVQRALAHLPRQGSRKPWKLRQNYALDLLDLRFSSVNDEAMEFVRADEEAKGRRRSAR